VSGTAIALPILVALAALPAAAGRTGRGVTIWAVLLAAAGTGYAVLAGEGAWAGTGAATTAVDALLVPLPLLAVAALARLAAFLGRGQVAGAVNRHVQAVAVAVLSGLAWSALAADLGLPDDRVGPVAVAWGLALATAASAAALLDVPPSSGRLGALWTVPERTAVLAYGTWAGLLLGHLTLAGVPGPSSDATAVPAPTALTLDGLEQALVCATLLASVGLLWKVKRNWRKNPR
jgi:hypothetical protein